MATVTTGTQTTNEDMKLTRDGLINYVHALHKLISLRQFHIKGYTPNEFEITFVIMNLETF